MQDLKKKRIESKITQIQLAKACEVSVNTIIKWENGVATPSDENYQKLLKALEVLPFTEPAEE